MLLAFVGGDQFRLSGIDGQAAATGWLGGHGDEPPSVFLHLLQILFIGFVFLVCPDNRFHSRAFQVNTWL